MCNPFFPMLNPSDPPPGFPRHNTPSQQYFPLLPGPPQAAAPQPPPPPAPARPTQGAAYMQPGPHAKLGFFIDTQNTETPDSALVGTLPQIATQIRLHIVVCKIATSFINRDSMRVITCF